MATDVKSVGLDEIVSSAASGVLRAFEARKIGAERLTVEDLVQSGFNIKFEIWAGGPWIRGPLGGPLFDDSQLGGKLPGG